jgi:hypothetical protein
VGLAWIVDHGGAFLPGRINRPVGQTYRGPLPFNFLDPVFLFDELDKKSVDLDKKDDDPDKESIDLDKQAANPSKKVSTSTKKVSSS